MDISWQKNLAHNLQTHPVNLLYGGMDRYLLPKRDRIALVGIEELITHLCQPRAVRVWDTYTKARDLTLRPTGLIDVVPCTDFGAVGFNPALDQMLTRMATALRQDEQPQLWLLRFAESYLPHRSSYSVEEGLRQVALLRAIESMSPSTRLVLLYATEGDIPLQLSSLPQAATFRIPTPAYAERHAFWRDRLCHGTEPPRETRQLLDSLANLSDGLSLSAVERIAELARPDSDHPRASAPTSVDLRALRLRDWERQIRLYKFGERENPYEKLEIEKLEEAPNFFTEKEGVSGQKAAITKVVAMLWKARTSVAELLYGSTSSPPRGVLFFCGPTGVGKTLVAKKTAKFCFGSEDAFFRIDMSEYQQDFAVSRLIGAPPGYVGHEMGGSLTNAIIKRPFSVVLFDEIEKAHPRVFDILLQLLSDGRLTDSRGQTAFFSESIVIFTSNLGTRPSELAMLDEARHSRDSTAVSQHFVRAVEAFFRHELGRPELLNRIGSNIVPFGYLDENSVIQATVKYHLDGLKRRFDEKYEGRMQLIVEPEVVDRFVAVYGDRVRQNGGRAVLNTLDEILLPKLARRLLLLEARRETRNVVVYASGNDELELRD